ncbi:hypothetical protein ACP70R_022546 [Stipagrostis hirtigluma subsp. patula]
MATLPTNLPSTSPAATTSVHRQWMLLAPYGECEAEGSSCLTADSDEAVAAAHTSLGHLISVSVRRAPPPATSRLRVRFPQGVKSTYATVVAAHGDALLTYVVTTAHGTDRLGPKTCTDYFVYDAGGGGGSTASPPPTLSLLPSPHPSTGRRWPNISATGLLLRRRGAAGEFVVAELKMVKDDRSGTPKKAAELLLFRSGEWCVKRPRIRGKDGEVTLPSSWKAEATVPLGEGLLCWVDSARGAIFSDVLEESPVLRYVPYPVEAMIPSCFWHSYLCVTARGTVNLVNMWPRCCPYGVRAWTLKTEDMAWAREAMDDCAAELWALVGINYGIARVQLVYDEDDGREKGKGKKRQVEDGWIRPRRSKRARKRNVRVMGPEWNNY